MAAADLILALVVLLEEPAAAGSVFERLGDLLAMPTEVVGAETFQKQDYGFEEINQ